MYEEHQCRIPDTMVVLEEPQHQECQNNTNTESMAMYCLDVAASKAVWITALQRHRRWSFWRVK